MPIRHMKILGIKWMWQKIDLLADGELIIIDIIKSTLLMGCDVSCQLKLDENIGAATWVINSLY